MGVQGFLPKSPESVIYSNPTALGQRPLLNLQSNEEPVVSRPCRGSVALAVGGGLSLSAFTLNWLGRKGRRRVRTGRTVIAPPIQDKAPASCASCCERCVLEVQYLYATPILRPGSSSRLPALRWQEEVKAVREALEIDDFEGSDGLATPFSASASSCGSTGSSSGTSSGTARMHVLVATVNRLARLAASRAPSGPGCSSWWHIAAHSEPGSGRLILEDEDGAPQVVSMSALVQCQHPPLGVSVLACEGEQAGRALLAAGASFAIVATGQLRDSTARLFSAHFYQRLHSASLEETGGNLASRVPLAFRGAKEALKLAASGAVRADAHQLRLLEKGCELPVRTLWVPVAMSLDEGCVRPADEAYEDDTVSELSSLSSTSSPQDCEDFVGRGSEIHQLLQILGAPGGRRVVVLHGPCGMGKSAIGAELCRFATAPGRRFAPVNGRQRLAYVSLQNSHSETGTAACAHLSIFAAAAGLASNGRACLLIDRAEREFGWRDEFVPEVLDKHPQLCLLITRRSPLYRLDGEQGDRWKPVNVPLGPLPDAEAAQLFLQRLHRPLFPSDLWPAAKAASCEPLRPNDDLLRRISSSSALVACGGLPRNVVRLAAEVTWELPSLLDLQPEWLKVESPVTEQAMTGP